MAQAAHALTEQLVGGGDPSLMVEEFGGPGVDQFDVGAVIDACTTPPFLVERRVVVVREAGQLTAADAKRLAGYLEEPLATTALVLVGGGDRPPDAHQGGLRRRRGGRHLGGDGRARSQWLTEHLSGGPVRLDAAATALLSEHLGGDMGRLEGLLDTLASAYGAGAKVSADDLEPFLGAAGSLAPWDLTDAIDAGDPAKALDVLHRMLASPDSHPLVVLSVLHRHFRQLLRLDGSGVTSPEEAARCWGCGAPIRPRRRWPSRDGWGRPHRPGHPAGGPGRSGRARGHRRCPERRCSRCWWPGWPGWSERAYRVRGPAAHELTVSLDWLPASATFSVQWKPSQ